jgi:hypothetical protein
MWHLAILIKEITMKNTHQYLLFFQNLMKGKDHASHCTSERE